jgi:hypothetical protein
MGYNSLVIFADSQNYKLAIKIFVINKNDLNTLDGIYKLVSDINISPKIYYDYNIDYNSSNFMIKIIASERLTPFSDFEWTSVKQMKKSIITCSIATYVIEHIWVYW